LTEAQADFTITVEFVRLLMLGDMSTLFPKQIRRLSFAGRLGVCLLIMPLIRLVFHFAWGEPANYPHTLVFKSLVWLVVIALTAYVLVFVVVPRLRDVGISPYVALLSLVPLINLLLLIFLGFAPSDRDAQHYWQSLENHRGV